MNQTTESDKLREAILKAKQKLDEQKIPVEGRGLWLNRAEIEALGVAEDRVTWYGDEGGTIGLVR